MPTLPPDPGQPHPLDEDGGGDDGGGDDDDDDDDGGGGGGGGGGDDDEDDGGGLGGGHGGIGGAPSLRAAPWPNGGALVQQRFMTPGGPTRGFFHLVTPLPSGGLALFTRDNTASGFPWHGPFMLSPAGSYSGASIILSDYGNLEVLAIRDGALEFFFHMDGTWRGPFPPETLTSDGAPVPLALPRLTGNPSLIQGSYGSKHRNFEALVALADGGLLHLWRNNQGQTTWRVGAELGHGTRFSGVALIQSDLRQRRDDAHGNLEAVAITRQGVLMRCFRNNLSLQWSSLGPVTRSGSTAEGLTGIPGFINTSYPAFSSDLKVKLGLAPAGGGGLQSFARDGNAADFFGGSIFDTRAEYSAVTLIESDYQSTDNSGHGNFEVVATRADGRGLDFFFWENEPHFTGAKHGPIRIVSVDDRSSVRSMLVRRGITGDPASLRPLGSESVRQLLSAS